MLGKRDHHDRDVEQQHERRRAHRNERPPVAGCPRRADRAPLQHFQPRLRFYVRGSGRSSVWGGSNGSGEKEPQSLGKELDQNGLRGMVPSGDPSDARSRTTGADTETAALARGSDLTPSVAQAMFRAEPLVLISGAETGVDEPEDGQPTRLASRSSRAGPGVRAAVREMWPLVTVAHPESPTVTMSSGEPAYAKTARSAEPSSAPHAIVRVVPAG